METRFEWDVGKAKANERKHGISFEAAIEIFADPFVVAQNDITDAGEQRERAIGMTRGLALVVVVFVDWSEPGVEIIRIISARKADAYEQGAYKDQFR